MLLEPTSPRVAVPEGKIVHGYVLSSSNVEGLRMPFGVRPLRSAQKSIPLNSLISFPWYWSSEGPDGDWRKDTPKKAVSWPFTELM